MCKVMGKPPKLSEMPIDIADFPPLVRDALEIFNRLGDSYVSTDLGPLYMGKNLITLETFFNIYEIENKADQRLVLEIVQHLDAKAVKKSMDAMKRKSKEMARKTKGR